MTQGLRSPAVLMTVYVGLFLYAGPWLGTGSPPHRNVPQALVAVLLMVLACRGSRAARALMIIYSARGVLVELFGGTHWWSAQVPGRIWYLACYMLQIGLLVSTPMHQRTRPGWWPGRIPPARFLPAPRLWAVMTGVAAGLVVTLLPLRRFAVVACPPGRGLAAPPARCLADGTGYPIAYRFDGGILTMHANRFHWLYVIAPRGIRAAALASDWAMWSLSILLALYLALLSMRRDDAGPADGRLLGYGQPAGP